MKPYAYIQFADDPDSGIDRVKRLIVMSNDDFSGFMFRQYNDLPDFISDSFSKGFCESASRLGKGVLVTVAQPI